MGFFDDMLAGGMAGLGKGMHEYGALQEREDEKRAQLAEQMALKRELLAEQLASKKELAEMRLGAAGSGGGGSGSGGGGGGSGGGSFFDKMLQTAQTPEDIEKTIRYAQLRGGPEAAAATAEYFGRPMQEMVTSEAPTTGDLARFDRGQQESVPEAVTSTRSVQYDKQKGTEALNRMIAMVDPGKYDDYIKGERGAMLNDNAGVAGATIKDPVKRAALEQSLTSPTADPNKVDASVDMNEARIKARAARPSGSGGSAEAARTKAEATEKTRAQDALQKALSLPELLPSDKKSKEAAVANARARVANATGNQPQKAAPTSDRLSQFKVIRN